MEESTQQVIALGLVAIVVGAELLRRWRKKKKKSAGCNDCDSPNTAANNSANNKETPLRFYRRR